MTVDGCASWANRAPTPGQIGFAADFTPVVGDIKGVVEAVMNPTVLAVTAAVVGLIPVLGDVAAKVLKGADDAVTLYRVVDGKELSSIRETGEFLPSPSGAETKSFLDNPGDANALRDTFQEKFGGTQTVVEGTASSDVVSQVARYEFHDVPGKPMQGIAVPNQSLPRVKPCMDKIGGCSP